ncbi:hypothetical protein [Bacteroides nordii]|uniref:hypothetical protein n=1 Tax=Bacteroides nordii TaxID=291645 RepID=UPI003999E351
MKVTVLPDQTLADIAIQEYGAPEAVFLLAQANDISPTATLTPGTTLERPDKVFNREMQAMQEQPRIARHGRNVGQRNAVADFHGTIYQTIHVEIMARTIRK